MRLAAAVAVVGLAACGGGNAELKSAPMPEGGSFTGVWFSPQYGRMDLVQTGDAVVGEYKKEERTGKLQGTARGDLLTFTWEESRELVAGRPAVTRGRGYFKYQVDPGTKEHKLVGEWGMDDQHAGGGPWNAVKSEKLEPELAGATSGGDSAADDYGSEDYGGGDSYDDSGSDDVLDDLL